MKMLVLRSSLVEDFVSGWEVVAPTLCIIAFKICGRCSRFRRYAKNKNARACMFARNAVYMQGTGRQKGCIAPPPLLLSTYALAAMLHTGRSAKNSKYFVCRQNDLFCSNHVPFEANVNFCTVRVRGSCKHICWQSSLCICLEEAPCGEHICTRAEDGATSVIILPVLRILRSCPVFFFFCFCCALYSLLLFYGFFSL